MGEKYSRGIYLTGKQHTQGGTMLEACQQLQDQILAARTSRQRQQALELARRAAKGMNRPGGNRTVIVKSQLGIVIPGDQQESDTQTHIEFDNVLVKGWLGRIAFMNYEDLNLVTWPLFDAATLNAEETELAPEDIFGMEDPHMPAERPSRLPIHLPVGFINYAIWSTNTSSRPVRPTS